ncbi:diguanylate phosphodiesterase, partial [Acinetobacter baumannii]
VDLKTPANTALTEKTTGLSAAWPQINRHLSTHPAQANALVLFRLAQCPERLFQQGWQTLGLYFNQLHGFLKDHAQMPIFQV